MKKLVLIIVALLSGQLAWSLDKEKLADHIIKALNEPVTTTVEVGDPEPSGFADLDAVEVTIQGFRQSEKRVIYLTKDHSKYFFGAVFELSKDPDKERFKQLDLKNAYYRGSKKAPVTIVEFSDLQCGYCQKAHEAFEKELYENYSDKEVRLIFKHFPLSMHDWAEEGAVAAECAGEQGNHYFWGMIDRYFKNSQTVTKDNVFEKGKRFSTELGLKRGAFNACLEKKEAREKVLKNKNEGMQIGVGSTPTFYVNGRMQRGFRDFESFKPLIDYKLKEAKK